MPGVNDKNSYVVGVDFGGTKILAGVFDDKFECRGRARVSTKADRSADEVIGRIARCVREAVDECDLDLKQIQAIGIGAPGAVDSDSGRVIFAPNLGWNDVPLKKELEKQIDVPVWLENDCNVCTLGVYEVELKAKPRELIGIFLGTGIGGGLILEGKLYSGFNRTAGEIGHMVLEIGGPKCGCGNKGCFEALASRTAIFRRIKEAVKEGLEVQGSAADEKSDLAACLDVLHDASSLVEPPGDAGRLPRVEDVEQVVRHPGALGGARLGRADVHAAVERHGVHADDLGAQALGQF